jgi:hypothetical protein
MGKLAVGDGVGSLTVDGTVGVRQSLPTTPIVIRPTAAYDGGTNLYGPVGAENPSGNAHLRLCRSGRCGAIDLRNCAIHANSPDADALGSSLEGLQPGHRNRTVSR